MTIQTLGEKETLSFHALAVARKERRFENAAESISRMILEKPIEKKNRGGRTIYDFMFFREGSRHIVGWYEEINEVANFVFDAAQGGSAKEMALVLVGQPGNGKTFFVDYLNDKYRHFLSRPENRRYTFKFVRLDEALGYHSKVSALESITYEDPMVLAMNLSADRGVSVKFLEKAGFDENAIEALFERRRPLGASTEYLWHELLTKYDDVEKCLEHVQIVPVSMRESLGTVTGKYSAKDKITSSAVDLLGEESLERILLLKPGDPNKFDLRRGALARVGGGGIHFSDEMFKNKKDLVQIYLQVIQNRNIELDGFIWPIDTFVVATSNNAEYNTFIQEQEQGPVRDRCKVCYVSHNTDYKLQFELTSYCLGSKKRTTVFGEPMHEDPNLNYAASVGVTLTRLLYSNQLTPVETMKLEAGEIAGEKGVKTLQEVKDIASTFPDVTKRWGQKGLGHRDLGRMLQILGAMPESSEGKCLFAKDVFKAEERVILDYVQEATDREKYLKDLRTARKLYREGIKTSIFNAFRDDANAIRKDVMAYVNMLIGLDAENLGPEKLWRYRDPQNPAEMKVIKIDVRYIESVEKRLKLTNNEQRESFRTTIRKIYGQKLPLDPNYDFMDNIELVKAVTDVRLESEVAGAGSLVGALANRTNEENKKIYSRMMETMDKKLGYCQTCAQKTIEYFCEGKEDEN